MEAAKVKPTWRLTSMCFVCCIVVLALNGLFLMCRRFPSGAYLQQETADTTCMSPALPSGQLEIVVGASLCSKPRAWDRIHSWVVRLGLPQVVVHIYWREHGCDTLHSWVQLPCGMQYKHHVLLPNMGNEAASFAEYIRTRYDSLPHSVAFVHEHGPNGWHSNCKVFYGRMTAYYRGLLELNDPSSRYGRLARNPMVSLAGGCGPSDAAARQGEGLDSAWIEIISEWALCSLDRGAPTMNWTYGLWRVWRDRRSSGQEQEYLDDDETFRAVENVESSVMERFEANRERRKKIAIEILPAKHYNTVNRCNAAVNSVERCPYQGGCNKAEGPGSFWSCCNSYIVKAEALRLQPKSLFEVFQSQCCFDKEHLSSASGRVMEYRAYAWFNGSEPSIETVSDLLWATQAQSKEVLDRGCAFARHDDDDSGDATETVFSGFDELMSANHGYL